MDSLAAQYTLPVAKVQGAVALPGGALLLSTSYGNATSRVYRWSPGAATATEVATGPAGFEDLTLTPDGLVWTATESGGKFYQKRGSNSNCSSSWTALYPYLFAWDVNSLGGL